MSGSEGKKTRRVFGTVNPYDGCRHGCLYCYARTIRKRRYDSWIDPKPRPQVLPRLRKDIRKVIETGLELPDVFVCSACDGYQPLELEHRLTRAVLEILIENEFPFTLVTKSDNALRDIDLIKGYGNCRVGCSIITLDEGFKSKLEPYSPRVEARIDALRTFKREGVSTFCLMEPIMPTRESSPFEIIAQLRDHVDLFMLGKWSPYVKKGIPVIYDEVYYADLFRRLIPYCEAEGIPYCITPHSEAFLEREGIDFRSYLEITGRP
jgi:DNA repair photolyase